MALSKVGYTFTDVNTGNPVIAGDTIALQRDISELHIYAQGEGLGSTQWERDSKEYSWGNNQTLMLMTSKDLIHWSGTNLKVNEAFL